jgi:hypothetical protein
MQNKGEKYKQIFGIYHKGVESVYESAEKEKWGKEKVIDTLKMTLLLLTVRIHDLLSPKELNTPAFQEIENKAWEDFRFYANQQEQNNINFEGAFFTALSQLKTNGIGNNDSNELSKKENYQEESIIEEAPPSQVPQQQNVINVVQQYIQEDVPQACDIHNAPQEIAEDQSHIENNLNQ